MTKDRVNISKDRYLWAIQRACLTLEDYIKSHPRIALLEWINGEKQPTTKQLEDFAKSVNVPFGYLLLEKTPTESIPFPVFRGDAGKHDHFDLNVYDTVNNIQQRQDWLEEYIRENNIETCKFVGKATLNMPITEAVNILREVLNLNKKWAFDYAATSLAINKLTEKLEEAGVFVAYNGIVANNTHRKLKVSECRGFALVNKIAPYIFVNSSDSPKAQLFTLIHEAAHILQGVSAGHAETNNLSDNETENWCDKVAAEFLVPKEEIEKIWDGNLEALSKKFKVSELVIARRAHDLNLMSDKDYQIFWNEYINRVPIQKIKSTGGSFYRTSTKRVGRLFAIHVRNAIESRQLSYVQAYRLTGLYGKTYNEFMKNHI